MEYTCQFCEKKFVRHSLYNEHLNQIHQQEDCPYCCRTYPRFEHDVSRCLAQKAKGPLGNLVFSIQQTKPNYPCQICHKTYSKLSFLKSHHTKMHKKILRPISRIFMKDLPTKLSGKCPENIPADVFYLIVRELDPTDLENFGKACHSFQKIMIQEKDRRRHVVNEKKRQVLDAMFHPILDRLFPLIQNKLKQEPIAISCQFVDLKNISVEEKLKILLYYSPELLVSICDSLIRVEWIHYVEKEFILTGSPYLHRPMKLLPEIQAKTLLSLLEKKIKY